MFYDRNKGAKETTILVKDLLVPEQCVEAIEVTVEKMGGERLLSFVSDFYSYSTLTTRLLEYNMPTLSLALHILVGNAGSGRLGTVRNSSVEDFRFNLDLNLTSNFVLTKHALPHLEKTRGNIVYISSVAGTVKMDVLFGYLWHANLTVFFISRRRNHAEGCRLQCI